jgi:hypothetical protein
MSDRSESLGDTRPCAYCGSPISIKAKLCPVCRSYQSGWRAGIIYIAGIAGLVSLVASAGAFVIGKLPELRKDLFWTDQVKVLEFESGLYPDYDVTLSNVGDGAVFVSKISVSMPDGYIADYWINELVQPGQIVALNYMEDFAPNYGDYEYNTSGAADPKTTKSAGVPSRGQEQPPCFGEILFSKDSRLLTKMRDRGLRDGTRLVEDDRAQAVVVYYSSRLKMPRREDPFPVATTFLQPSASRHECDPR